MEHQGRRLKGMALAKGYDIQQLADTLEMHRVTVEKDFKDEKLTRKRLKKYESLLGFSSNEFYIQPETLDKQTENKDANKIEKLQAEIIYWQRKYIDLQERFFPNAAQLA